MPYTLEHLEGDNAFAASFELMRVLRPHISRLDDYKAQLARQSRQGYRLLAASSTEGIVGLIGYRELENLLYGRFIYVDDLVVTPGIQNSGLGRQLLKAVREVAEQRDCDHLVLDTGLHMPLAQRFYFRQGLLARGLHFSESLRAQNLP